MKRGFRAMVRALQHASAYPHPAGHVVRIETHLSVIYLAGRYAYKIKKPVRFDFVDFSTREARSRSCREEFRLNRQFARPLYLSVVPVARRGRSFAFASCGQAAEYAVKMRRFDERGVFSALAARGELSTSDIDRLAQRLAQSHRHAPRNPPKHGFGTAACIREQVQVVLDSLDRQAPALVPRPLRDWCEVEMTRLVEHFDARRTAGFVRGCHGDLHLANVVRRGQNVLMFDCIEFSDALRWIDIVTDLAFPVMDLLAYGQADRACRLLNGWVTATGDFAGLAALRLFVVYRALVRALVAVLKAAGSEHRGAVPEAARYLRVAERAAARQRPFLLLCHGFSGSGKSAASEALAPLIGAVRVSSDIERKRIAALSAPGLAPLPAAAYTRESIDAQYEKLLSITDTLLLNGYPVIVDASFLKQAHRARFIELASTHAVPVWILDFQAKPARLERRIRTRLALADSPSDADLSVLRRQFANTQPLTDEEAALAIAFDTDVQLAEFHTRAYWRALFERVPTPGFLATCSMSRA
ncbi:MAG: AAA family ATPase [Trinickia sp.]|uniref:bifunctional aminoglycoside phosphotransferase/ATP-binding protein n=1 Tax=Trinickia sp. TaxID=2571163 RepID=UPI003F7E7E1E